MVEGNSMHIQQGLAILGELGLRNIGQCGVVVDGLSASLFNNYSLHGIFFFVCLFVGDLFCLQGSWYKEDVVCLSVCW